MRTFLLLVVLSVSASIALGQSVEYSGQLYSGLSWFGGESATSSSFIVVSDVANSPNYTNHPYGKKTGVAYVASLQVQKITPKNWVFGAQAGYEVLRSKLDISGVSSNSNRLITIIDGQTVLRNTFINTHLFFGRRLQNKN